MRWIVSLVGGVCVLAVAAYTALHLESVQSLLITQTIAAQMSSDRATLFKTDALRVALCGTTGPMPDRTRAKHCNVVIAGDKYYVVDLGPESTEVITQWRLPAERLGGVFLTHFHSDHIGELGEFNLMSWAQGRGKALSVYGPPGVDGVVAGFQQAYALDRDYRVAHHGADLMPPDHYAMVPVTVTLDGLMSPTRERKGIAFQDGDLTVTAIEVQHSPVEPSYAYRFDYKGRSVVITGDTAKHLPLAMHAKNADVLVHEAQAKTVVAHMIAGAQKAGDARLTKIFQDIQSYHASPIEAAEIANAAEVKLLVLTHFTPPPNNLVLKIAYGQGMGTVAKTDWVMGEDGMLITLPVADPKAVIHGRLP